MSNLTVSLIQSPLHWENKEKNLRMFEEKITAMKEKTEVVILPEMFSTGFSMNPEALAETMDGEAVAWMKKISREKKIVLTGSLIIKDGEDYFNRLIWMLPNGQHGVYDKRHRFAYAGEHEKFGAGTKRLIASVKGWRVNLMICYDLRFPVWARQQRSDEIESEEAPVKEQEYDLLIYVANWPEKRSHAWKTLLQARAIENQSYVIGLNRVGDDANNIHYSGDSMIVDPLGEILIQKAHEETIITHELQKEKLEEIRNKFPFWKDADDFNLLL
jgi:predicted amidohydrolase